MSSPERVLKGVVVGHLAKDKKVQKEISGNLATAAAET
jgi:hypothetical protein